MLTLVLIVAASVLAVAACVLIVVLVQGEREARAPAVAPPPARDPEPLPEPELALDLHEAAARIREPARLEIVVGTVAEATTDAEAESRDLDDVLGRALEAALAIPGVDAALVTVSLGREPIVGTLGLARHESDRLVRTLPTAGTGTHSIEITYEYGRDVYAEGAAGRIEHGLAIPVPGTTPALLAILTRVPAADLGGPQLELLQEVARRLAPALAAVGDDRATRMPVAISVRELGSIQGEEGHKAGQVDRLGRR